MQFHFFPPQFIQMCMGVQSVLSKSSGMKSDKIQRMIGQVFLTLTEFCVELCFVSIHSFPVKAELSCRFCGMSFDE